MWEACGWEEQLKGQQWWNIDLSGQTNQWNYAGSIYMLAVDTVIYAILIWYIEAVFPGKRTS